MFLVISDQPYRHIQKECSVHKNIERVWVRSITGITLIYYWIFIVLKQIFLALLQNFVFHFSPICPRPPILDEEASSHPSSSLFPFLITMPFNQDLINFP